MKTVPTSTPAQPPTGLILPTQADERRLWKAGFRCVAGIDEVGRGPIAGPVVAAAVVLPDLGRRKIGELHLIRDSKLLSAVQRERAAALVRDLAVDSGVGEASHEEIDAIGIVPATKLAMRRALDRLSRPPDHLLIDAVFLDWRGMPCMSLVRADQQCMAVAAASIMAKVHRDALMCELDVVYPGYGFAAHKGYAAATHLEALGALGPSPVHRRSFSPLAPSLPLVFDDAPAAGVISAPGQDGYA